MTISEILDLYKDTAFLPYGMTELLLGLWADESRQGGSQLDTYEEMEGRIDERA